MGFFTDSLLFSNMKSNHDFYYYNHYSELFKNASRLIYEIIHSKYSHVFKMYTNGIYIFVCLLYSFVLVWFIFVFLSKFMFLFMMPVSDYINTPNYINTPKSVYSYIFWLIWITLILHIFFQSIDWNWILTVTIYIESDSYAWLHNGK